MIAQVVSERDEAPCTNAYVVNDFDVRFGRMIDACMGSHMYSYRNRSILLDRLVENGV